MQNAPGNGNMTRTIELLERNWKYLLVAALLLFIAFSLTDFGGEFVWKYYWGPVVADAEGEPVSGIKEGYNTVNTITYAFLMAISIAIIYKILEWLKVELDYKFFLAMVPYIVLGATLRSLEDSNLFLKPLTYLFIAPVVYLVVGISTLFIVIFAVGLERKVPDRLKLQFMAIPFLGINVLYWNMVYMDGLDYAISPVFVLLLTTIQFVSLRNIFRRKGKFSYIYSTFVIGETLMIMALAYIAMWFLGFNWQNSHMYGGEMIAIPALAFFLTIIVYIVCRKLDTEISRIFISPINILIVMAHLMDASATYRAIEYFSYAEKHVLPRFLIDTTGTALVMFPLKAVTVFFALYLIDIEFRKETEGYDILIGLVKLSIFILGLAPGLRDMMRLGMGV